MSRFDKIAACLGDYGLDAMMVTSEPNRLYAAGFHSTAGMAIVTAEGSYFFTDSRYIEAATRRIGSCQVLENTREKPMSALAREVIARHHIQKLGFEESYTTVEEYNGWREKLPCELVPAQSLVNNLRAAKDEEEIALMKKAQEITDQAFEAILKFIQPGMTEQEIAARLQYEMLCRGAEKMSFDPIVASGPNGSKPHAIPGDKQVQKGEFITMDFGCKVGGYCSDMTRTVALGEPTEEMRKVYDTVLQAQLAGIAKARAGVPGKEIHNTAAQVIEEAGYGPYFGHGFGHSVGIEIHEAPNANGRDETPMPVGAVVSAEPGIYLPGKFGVRIEDVLIYTAEGSEDITKSPKELIVL